ncbi:MULTISPECIES: alpha/beta fold hydrolase [Nocardia]|uniref:alpha/beta fold hydrolase n=1 Tax=Nocardia TaxID=1817 RepID=UPI00245753FB|nr:MULTISPECIES: alpha/beta fold hydrolase [Nocardia]
MIRQVAAEDDYGSAASPGWRHTDWSQFERDTMIGSRRLRYLDVGEGERCFVLVHGMGGRWQHWLETIPALARHGRVLALDLPGFGRSQRANPRATVDGFADTAAALARQLGQRRVVLIGHSMGGPIAIRFAARHPDLAEAIVLVCGATYQFSNLLGLRNVRRFMVERPRETAAIAMEIATAGLPAPRPLRRLIVASPRLRKLFLSPYVRDPSALPADALRLVVDGAGAPGVFPAVRAIARADPLDGIDKVRCPILSLAADNDRIVPLPDTEAFQHDVPRAQTVVFAGCGHMPMLERPEAFTTELINFTRTLP